MADARYEVAGETASVLPAPAQSGASLGSGAREAQVQRIVRDMGRRERRRRIRDLGLGVLTPVVLIAAWQICADAGVIDVNIFSSPSGVIHSAVTFSDSGVYQHDVGITVLQLVIGYLGGSFAGIAVGLLVGYFRVLRAALAPVIAFGYAIPMITILPIMLVIFGLGELPKILTVGIAVFFIVEISTMETVRRIDTRLLEAGRAYGALRGRLFRHVLFPAALPGIFTGLRVAAPIALVVVIAIEFVASNSGLGYLIWNSWTIFLPSGIYLGVVSSAALGGLFTGLVVLVRRAALPWLRAAGRP